MASIYSIRDNVCNCDCFTFLENTNGNAKTYFNAWTNMQAHRDFTLYCIGTIEFVEKDEAGTSDAYSITYRMRDELLNAKTLENNDND